MEAAARKRRERLEELRKKASHSNNQPPTPTASDTAKERDEIRAAVKEVEAEVEKFAQEALDNASKQQKAEIDIFNLAPQNPDFDLKRDLETKMSRLNKETDQAITAIIRARIRGEKVGDLKALPIDEDVDSD